MCFHERIDSSKLLQECESGVSLDYLEKLHQEYIKFINEMRSNGSQVLTYDWSIFKDEAIVRRNTIFIKRHTTKIGVVRTVQKPLSVNL